MRTLIKLFFAFMLCISPSAYAEKPSKSANKPIAPKTSCPTGTSNTQKTKAEDLALLKAKAEQGNAGNHWSLGYRHEGGFDVAQDHVKAVEWYMLAAAQEDAAAQVSLGSMYDNGRGGRSRLC